MTLEQFNLNWRTYSDHLKEMMQNLMETNISTDVTIVCEDKTQLKSHKFVLNACSPVIQSIIEDLPENENSVVYLRGVFAPEMKSILQFMYLGQATLYQDRIKEFLNVAKCLEIKEISKDVEMGTEENESKPNLGPKNTMEEINNKESKLSSYQNESGQYLCDKCDKEFSYKRNLNHHYKSVHEGFRYPCNKCDKTFTSSRDATRHIQAVHDGLKHKCDRCDAVFSYFEKLQHHKKNKH